MKIVFSKNEIIAIVLATVMIKAGLYVYPLAEPYFAESSYTAVTGEFEKKSVQDMEIDSTDQNNSSMYYIGRPNCIDCRMSINNTRILYRICNEKEDRKMYYVRLKNEISDSERKYLDSISVDNIPTIVAFKDGQAIQFGYEDINSEQFKEKFEVFMNTGGEVNGFYKTTVP